jgi:hypothetical protein
MSDLEHNAAYWRAKAEEARATADSLESPEARKHMLSCAASYERLAELAERKPPQHIVKTANSN